MNNDTLKRKNLIWLDGGEVKSVDFGYDWHTNVKPQAFIKAESEVEVDNKAVIYDRKRDGEKHRSILD